MLEKIELRRPMLMRHVDQLFKRGTSEEEVAEHSRKAFVQAIRRKNTRMELLADFCIVLGEEGLNTACKEASNTLTEEAAYYSASEAPAVFNSSHYADADVTPLIVACRGYAHHAVEMMLLFKADPNMKMHYIASSHNQPGAPIVKALLNAKANPELPMTCPAPRKKMAGLHSMLRWLKLAAQVRQLSSC